MSTTPITLAQLESHLWEAANILRGADIAPLPEAVAAFKDATAHCCEVEDHLHTVMIEGGWL